jgi:hypothetical protein
MVLRRATIVGLSGRRRRLVGFENGKLGGAATSGIGHAKLSGGNGGHRDGTQGGVDDGGGRVLAAATAAAIVTNVTTSIKWRESA